MKNLFLVVLLACGLSITSLARDVIGRIPPMIPINPDVLALQPQAPTLLSPADGYSVNTIHIPRQIFSWQPSASGPTTDFYLLNISDADNANGFKAEFSTTARAMGMDLPVQLADKRFQWSVTACRNGPHGTRYCSSPSSPWMLSWSTLLPAPDLLSPAHGASVAEGIVNFQWRPVSGATHYLLCVSLDGVACPVGPTSPSDSTVIRLAATTYSIDVKKFGERPTNWTAAACNSYGKCTYQQEVNALQIVRKRPELVRPQNNVTEGTRPSFEWTAVERVDAYFLCVSKPGVACGNQLVEPGSNPELMVVPYYQTRTDNENALFGINQDPDLAQFKGQTVNWTVGACRGQYTYDCVYQNQTRSITIEGRREVRATLTHLEVRDDCDSLSEGEWKVRFLAGHAIDLNAPFPLIYGLQTSDFPSTNGIGRGVEGGQTLRIDQTLLVHHLKDNEGLVLAASAVDCDNDGIWTLLNVFKGIPGLVDTVSNWTQTCHGEEAWEATGANDRIGEVFLELDPYHLDRSTTQTFSITAPGGFDCGQNPYTANFEVTTYIP